MILGRSLAALLFGLAPCVAAVALAAPAADAPGDAGLGRAIFEGKGCGRCHLPQGQEQGMGPALEVIRRPQGAFQLAGRLWNHAPGMFATFEKEGLKWPEMAREQMADLMAYLMAEPSRDPAPDLFQGGVMVIRKGCLKCHQLQGEGSSAAIDLIRYHGRYESPVTWATTVWNHSPKMAGLAARSGILYPRFSGNEMGNLVEFLRGAAVASPR